MYVNRMILLFEERGQTGCQSYHTSLDNMTPATLREAVALVAGRAVTEASGGITPQNAAAVAATGVDVISLGWLTHSAPALDVALEVVVG